MLFVLFSSNGILPCEGAGMLRSILLAPNNLRRLYSSCEEFHGSFVHFILHFKVMLAHFFSNRGECFFS